MILFFLLIPFCLYGETVWQQSSNNTSASIEISPAKPTVADSLELILRFQLPEGANVKFSSDWLQDDLSAFKLIAKTPLPNGIRFLLEPLYAGAFYLRTPPVAILHGSEVLANYAIPPILLTIAAVEENSTLKPEQLIPSDELFPIEISRENAQMFAKPSSPEENMRIFKERSFPFGKLLLALGAIVFLIGLLFGLRRSPQIQAEGSKTSLLKTLQDIENSFSSNEIEPRLYQELNFKMREYIQKKFGIDAPYLTTEEFIEQASRHGNVDSKNREILKDFLKESDRVKFKGKNPTIQDLDSSLKLVHKLIKSLFLGS